jgi:hypothetical protein
MSIAQQESSPNHISSPPRKKIRQSKSEKALPEPEEAAPKPEKPSIPIIQQESPYGHIPYRPGRKMGQLNKKRTLPEPEETTPKPGETLPNYDELEQKWFQTLERLHHCEMSTKYAAAMSDEQGDWNFQL